ncbi:hypothetical protein DKX38_020835 [Salix brachista]|uniref:Uncharacterized protein n=1 Tax=Salix brachista TaxID=2182728 RepID=A0A5N5K6G2_9ROSI|nr:hypothetical protein DKX38_020835 [Salix brachista]
MANWSDLQVPYLELFVNNFADLNFQLVPTDYSCTFSNLFAFSGLGIGLLLLDPPLYEVAVDSFCVFSKSFSYMVLSKGSDHRDSYVWLACPAPGRLLSWDILATKAAAVACSSRNSPFPMVLLEILCHKKCHHSYGKLKGCERG